MTDVAKIYSIANRFSIPQETIHSYRYDEQYSELIVNDITIAAKVVTEDFPNIVKNRQAIPPLGYEIGNIYVDKLDYKGRQLYLIYISNEDYK